MKQQTNKETTKFVYPAFLAFNSLTLVIRMLSIFLVQGGGPLNLKQEAWGRGSTGKCMLSAATTATISHTLLDSLGHREAAQEGLS